MTGAFFMVQIIFLIETVAQSKAEEISPAKVCHQGEMGVDVVMQLIAGSDFLIDVSFAEGDVVVFQVPAKLEIIRQPVHGHGVAQVEIESGQLVGLEIDGVITRQGLVGEVKCQRETRADAAVGRNRDEQVGGEIVDVVVVGGVAAQGL